jgi:Ni/Fe-hydrogenase subunit HybB-like protein
VEKDALVGLGKLTACVLWIYIAVRVIDLAYRGHLATAWGGGKGNLFLLEVGFGVLLPGAMLTSRRLRSRTGALVAAATLVVLGVVFNRLSVSWLGMAAAGKEPYFPSMLEILITLSMIAAIALVFTLAAKLFPVFATSDATGPEVPRTSEGTG